MIDFILGLGFAALALRGWLRGFAKELVDLAGMLAGIAVAFRFAGLAGGFFAEAFGVPPELARIGAGIALFIIVGITFSILGRLLHRFFARPGLQLSNRLLGAAFALAWGVFLAIVIVGFVRVFPLPDDLEDQIESSAMVEALTDETQLPQQIFTLLAGDRVLATVGRLEGLFGVRRLVVDRGDVVELGSAEDDQFGEDASEAGLVTELVNRSRVEAGEDPLARATVLDAVAQASALEIYRSGRLTHDIGGPLSGRLLTAGMPVTVADQVVGLAADGRSVVAAFVDHAEAREVLARSDVRRIGVGAVDGPLGLVVVIVVTG